MLIIVVLFLLLFVFKFIDFPLFNQLANFIGEGFDYVKRLFTANVDFFKFFEPMGRLFSSHPIFIILGALCIVVTFFVILRNR